MSITWNPLWLQHGESMWSVANKIAFACDASVDQALEQLAGVKRRRRESWLFPTMAQAQLTCRHLGVSVARANNGLFADVDRALSLAERECWQLAIRYCPACMQGFMHQACFQDRRRRYCHHHGLRLLDRCLNCGSAIDPMCRRPWSCNYCHAALVQPSPLTWPTQFRLGPQIGDLPRRPAKEAAMPMVPIWGVSVNPANVSHLAYEEHAAICSAWLGGHAECVMREPEAATRCGSPIYFLCPLAAASLFCANQLGFGAQCLDGVWTTGRPRRSDRAMAHLLFAASSWPKRTLGRQVRAYVRSWFAEALEEFVAAAAAGKACAVWVPRPQPASRFRDPGDAIARLAAEAATLCKQPPPAG